MKQHPITLTPVESSNLAAVGHCPDCDAIYVRFKSGAFWKYEPRGQADKTTSGKAIYDELMKADSKGKAFLAKVKPPRVPTSNHPFAERRLPEWE